MRSPNPQGYCSALEDLSCGPNRVFHSNRVRSRREVKYNIANCVAGGASGDI